VAATTGNFRLGPDNGRVVLKTGRAGFAARAGHDLTLEVTRWSAQVDVPEEDAGGLAAATVKAEFDLGDIKKQIAGILGTGTATFTSTRIVGSGSSGGVEGTFSLNGQSEPVRLQVSEPSPGRYRGSATVIQTGLGLKPYVGFFGALKLKDEVGVEFEVTLPA
jgi:hypothetical protein